jgi:hypothetical protein
LTAVSNSSLARGGDVETAGRPFGDERDSLASTRLVVELMCVPEPADRTYVASVRRRLAEARFGARLLIEDASLPGSGADAVPAD